MDSKAVEIILADGTPGESLEKHTLLYKNKLQLFGLELCY